MGIQRCLSLLLLGGMLLNAPAPAQPDVSYLAVKLGAIRNLQDDDLSAGKHHSLYPEVEIGGNLFTASVRWGIYGGVWDDGISEALPVRDYVTYSYHTYIAGARLAYVFTESQSGKPLPLMLGFVTGFSRHYVKASYVAGAGIDGRPGSDFSGEFNTFDFGVQVGIKLFGPLRLLGEVQQFVPINAERDLFNVNRRAYKTGIVVGF